MSYIPRAALDAAGNALRTRWLGELPNVALPAYGLDPMEWAATALEAAMPHLAASSCPASSPQIVIKVGRKLDQATLEKLMAAIRGSAP